VNSKEYQREFIRLEKKFGYDFEFSKHLWLAVKDLPDGIFTKTVEELFGDSHRFPPKRDDIVNLAASIMGRAKPKALPCSHIGEKPAQLSPWPGFLENLMLKIEEGQSGPEFEFICRYNRVTVEEAHSLFRLFKEKKYDDPFALEIIGRLHGRTGPKGTFRTVRKTG
jgi:hypothetical protein